MPQNAPAACQGCGGFARVAIAIGNRRPDGSRPLLFVECRVCGGDGYAPAWLITDSNTALTTVGR